MQIWHISVLNESFHINHGILADFPNLPQMLMALIPVAAPCQTGSRALVDTVLSSCVFSELPCFLEKELHFRQQQKQCQHKISSPAPVASWSLQGVCRKDSSNSFQQLLNHFGARAVELYDLGVSWLLWVYIFHCCWKGIIACLGGFPRHGQDIQIPHFSWELRTALSSLGAVLKSVAFFFSSWRVALQREEDAVRQH